MATADKDGRIAQMLSDRMACLVIELHESPRPKPRTHAPWCDSVLGPDFEVTPGEVRMTIFACVNYECWDEAP